MPSLQQLRYKLDKSRQVAYNHSMLISTQEPAPEIRESIAEIYEICRQFELQHQCDSDEVDVYTGDDAFPDSYNHSAWLHHQIVNDQELEWERTKSNRQGTLSLWEKLDSMKDKLMEMKA